DVACLIAAGATSRQKPAISAVLVLEPHFHVVFVPFFDSLLPAPDDPVAVLGVDRLGPSVTDRLTLRETRIVVPVRIAVADLSIGLTEPDDLGRQLEEALEFCSSGNAPPLESSHAPGGHEENNADDRENQSDLEGAEEQTVARFPGERAAADLRGCHAGVLHSNGRSREQECCAGTTDEGTIFGIDIEKLASRPKRQGREDHGEPDRRAEDPGIIDDRSARAHSRHSRVVHPGDSGAHQNTGECQHRETHAAATTAAMTEARRRRMSYQVGIDGWSASIPTKPMLQSPRAKESAPALIHRVRRRPSLARIRWAISTATKAPRMATTMERITRATL